jgi:hypothetical protein
MSLIQNPSLIVNGLVVVAVLVLSILVGILWTSSPDEVDNTATITSSSAPRPGAFFAQTKWEQTAGAGSNTFYPALDSVIVNNLKGVSYDPTNKSILVPRDRLIKLTAGFMVNTNSTGIVSLFNEKSDGSLDTLNYRDQSAWGTEPQRVVFNTVFSGKVLDTVAIKLRFEGSVQDFEVARGCYVMITDLGPAV